MIRATTMDTVKVHYTGKLADGTVFDKSPEDRPLLFILGKEEVIAGFDEAIVGMYQGEEKTVVIEPDKAYGPSNADLIQEVDRKDLPSDIELTEGGQLEVTREDGSKVLIMISALSDDKVTLDANHPLAGKQLTFEIKLLEVRKEQPKPSLPPLPDQPE
jgi:peptidylprolyl isomerase